MNFDWSCPYCDRAQIVSQTNFSESHSEFHTGGDAIEGRIGLRSQAVTCSNPQCKRTTVSIVVRKFSNNQNGLGRAVASSASDLFTRCILPEGSSKVIAEYVPKAIRDDYREACLIRDLSPKASATLARRCLQGMIRDFAQIDVKSKKLIDEIKALEKAVEDNTAPRSVSIDSIAALTAVRKVGNIGAHMEKDIDLIVDVDANEAQTLLDLIENLIDDWYVNRQKRQTTFGAAIWVSDQKQAQITDGRAATLTIAATVPKNP